MNRFALLAALLTVALVASTGCKSHDSKSMAQVPPPAPTGPPVTSSNTDLYSTSTTTSTVPPVTPIDPTPIPTLPRTQENDVETVTLGAPVNTTTTSSTYVVQRGDTLWRIASNKYGDGQKWRDIVNANPGLTPQQLRIGQTIKLP